MDMETLTGPKASMELCLPASSLSIDGTNPAEGDPVNFTLEGTVTRVENGNVYITPDLVNGEAVQNPAAPLDEEAELLNMAREADELENYG